MKGLTGAAGVSIILGVIYTPYGETMPAKRKPTGAENLAKAGKTGFLIGLTPEEKQWIREGAARAALSMSEFIVVSAVNAAKKNLAKSVRNS